MARAGGSIVRLSAGSGVALDGRPALGVVLRIGANPNNKEWRFLGGRHGLKVRNRHQFVGARWLRREKNGTSFGPGPGIAPEPA